MDTKKKTRKKQKWRLWQRCLFWEIVILLLMFLVELVANWGYLCLSDEERGVREISSDSITANGFQLTNAGYSYDGEKASLRIDLGGQYVEKFVYTYDYEGLLDMQVTIQYHNEFETAAQKTQEDKNSAVIRRSVIDIDEKVDWIDLYTDTDYLLEAGVEDKLLENLPLTLTGFSIQNTFQWNGVRMLWVLVIGNVILLLLMFKGYFGKRIEAAFLLICLSGGILLLSCFPASKVGWDEDTHFYRAYQLSVYPGGEEVSGELLKHFVSSVETWAWNLPDTMEERQEINEYFEETCSEGRDGVIQSGNPQIYTSGYVASALCLKLGRQLHMPFTVLYQFGRLGNLLLYAIVMTYAIKILPVGKRLLMLIGLMPTSIFLACCYSYDPTVTAFTALGTALVLREALAKERKVSWKNLGLSIFFFMWGILPKAVYAPLVLLVFLIPADRFDNKKQKWIARRRPFSWL